MIYLSLFFGLLYIYITLYVCLIFLLLCLLCFLFLVLSLNYFLKTFYSFHLAQNICLHCLVYLLLLNCFFLLFFLFVLYLQILQEGIIHVLLILLEYSIIHITKSHFLPPALFLFFHYLHKAGAVRFFALKAQKKRYRQVTLPPGEKLYFWIYHKQVYDKSCSSIFHLPLAYFIR